MDLKQVRTLWTECNLLDLWFFRPTCTVHSDDMFKYRTGEDVKTLLSSQPCRVQVTKHCNQGGTYDRFTITKDMRPAEELWITKNDETWPALFQVVPLPAKSVISKDLRVPGSSSASSCLYRFGSNLYRLTVLQSYDLRLEPIHQEEEKMKSTTTTLASTPEKNAN